MSAIPSDASTLIYIAKADAFQDVAMFVRALEAPPAVWREAVEAGEAIGARDVTQIRSAWSSGMVTRVDLPERDAILAAEVAAEHRLGSGESEVIAIGARRRRIVILDEGRAARIGRALGLHVLSTLFLPVVGFMLGAIDERHAVALLHRLAVVTGARSDVVFALEQQIRSTTR